MLTTGPTRAYLDPIRYLTNYSTGALGFLLAKKLIEKGFEVAVVSGPCSQPFQKLAGLKLIQVETADQMLRETLNLCKSFKPDYAVFTAAVLDFRPQKFDRSKKTSRSHWTITLIPNPKIIDEVGRLYPGIKRIGFKLETEKPSEAEFEKTAKSLLSRKKLEGVCMNFFQDIGKKKHQAWFFCKSGKKKLSTKSQIAKFIVHFVSQTNKMM